ncbi:hypothetical protein ACFSAV_04025 [Pasteurella oralis]|uniref:Uncharacterized protein n=1 Tax=Pasteurella oralis TaxID=1071947 RepID=A0ABW4NTF4_9PAST
MHNINVKNIIKLFLLKFLRNKYQYKINIENNIVKIEKKYDEFDLSQLNYVYLVKDPDIRNNRLTLYLNDIFKIGVNYRGFTKMYQELSCRFGFDDALFFQYLYKKGPFSIQIWRKKQIQNYDILDEEYTDYTQGFEIQSPEKKFIPWGTTYEALFQHTQFEEKWISYNFIYPIRIGRLLLKNVWLTPSVRRDVPILELYTDCYHESATEKSYLELKSSLTNNKKLITSFSEERNNPKLYKSVVNFNHIEFELHYHRHFKYYFDTGYSKLIIRNNTEYLEYVINEPYESQLIISDYLIIDHQDLIKIDYTYSASVKRRPPKIKEKFRDGQTVIWTDDVNHKIGFTSNDRAIVFDKNEIECFTLANTETTRRNNESSLTICFFDKNKEAITIFLAEHHFLTQYVDKIKTLTQKEVLYIEQYIEDV